MLNTQVQQKYVTFMAAAGIILALIFAGVMLGPDMFIIVGVLIPACIVALLCIDRPLVIVTLSYLWHTMCFFTSPTYFPYLYYRVYYIVQYTDELLLVPLFAALFFHVMLGRKTGAPKVALWWGAVIAVAALSGFVNGSGLLKTLSFLQAYFRNVILFFVGAVCFKPEEKNYRRIAYLFIGTSFLQFVLTAGWRLGINPLPNRFAIPGPDWAVGTMGSSTYVCYFASICLCLAAVGLMDRDNLGVKFRWMVFALINVVLVVVSQTKHAILMMAASLLFLVLFNRRGAGLRKWTLFPLSVLLIVLIIWLYNVPYQKKYESWVSGRWLVSTTQVKQKSHRDVVRVLTAEKAWPLGMGPGQFSSVVAYWKQSPLFARYFYAELDQRRYNPGSTIMDMPRTGMLSLLGDTGILGLGAYIGLYASVFIPIFLRLRRGAYDATPWGRRLAAGWCGWAVFYFLLNVLHDHLNYGMPTFLMWAWAGVMWAAPAAGPAAASKPPES